MGDEVITTGVDDLLALLKGKDRVAVQDAASALGIPPETLQAWVDFLVEEKIIGLEYKFTKPFIYLNVEEKAAKAHLIEKTTASFDQVRLEYEQHAREKQIPTTKIPQLWKAHVEEALERKYSYFIEQAKRRNAGDTERLWREYQADLLSRV